MYFILPNETVAVGIVIGIGFVPIATKGESFNMTLLSKNDRLDALTQFNQLVIDKRTHEIQSKEKLVGLDDSSIQAYFDT